MVNRLAAAMMCAVVFLAACVGFDEPGTTTTTSPTTVTTTTTMAATTTVEPLLPGEVLFADPGNPGLLHPEITWSQGASPQSAYRLYGNQLEITAGPGSDQWGDIDNAPLALMPMEGDFTARAVLSFTPDAGWEYAGLGVRSRQDPTTWVRITRFQGGLEENEVLVDVANAGESGDPLARAETAAVAVTFEIERNGNRFSLGYLAESEWVTLLDDYVLEMPRSVDLYLVVGTLSETTATHRFSDLIVRG
jgi:regulation of enolase protein 1 (concanavalin A-like superfamily)